MDELIQNQITAIRAGSNTSINTSTLHDAHVWLILVGHHPSGSSSDVIELLDLLTAMSLLIQWIRRTRNERPYEPPQISTQPPIAPSISLDFSFKSLVSAELYLRRDSDLARM